MPSARVLCAAVAVALVSFCVLAVAADPPLPFTRTITPGATGNDVIVAQNLLARSPSLSAPLPLSGTWDMASVMAALQFQQSQNLTVSGNVDAATAALLLKMFNADGVRDQGLSARQLGYMFKLVISVHGNRSVEAPATLFDADNKPLLAFIVRTHGHRDNDPTIPWPDFGDGDVGLNQFSSNGATVTGMIEVDLNTPEPDPKLYGPYPVTRLVRGLKGNAQFLMPNIRDGLLLHTGNWSVPGHPWDPSQTMPNSDGCIHGHPNDIKAVAEMLQSIGVVANQNPFSGKNYPFKPQGIAFVQRID